MARKDIFGKNPAEWSKDDFEKLLEFAWEAADELTRIQRLRKIGIYLWNLAKPRTMAINIGVSGAGKSAVHDALVYFDEALKPNVEKYAKESTSIEKGVVNLDSCRLVIKTVPGELDKPINMQAVEREFDKFIQPKILFHTVSNGLTRDTGTSITAPIRQLQAIGTSLPDIQKTQRMSEITDLHSIVKFVRGFLRNNSHDEYSKIYIITVLTKIDLYFDRIQEVINAYFRPSQSGYSYFDVINSLLVEFPERVVWRTMPVCSVIDNFEYGTETLLSQFDLNQQNATIRHFLAAMIDIASEIHDIAVESTDV